MWLTCKFFGIGDSLPSPCSPSLSLFRHAARNCAQTSPLSRNSLLPPSGGRSGEIRTPPGPTSNLWEEMSVDAGEATAACGRMSKATPANRAYARIGNLRGGTASVQKKGDERTLTAQCREPRRRSARPATQNERPPKLEPRAAFGHSLRRGQRCGGMQQVHRLNAAGLHNVPRT